MTRIELMLTDIIEADKLTEQRTKSNNIFTINQNNGVPHYKRPNTILTFSLWREMSTLSGTLGVVIKY